VELREELLKLAGQNPRFGYRRLHAVLERRGQTEGCVANEGTGYVQLVNSPWSQRTAC